MRALMLCLVVSCSIASAWAQENDPATVLLEYHSTLKNSFSFDPLIPFYTVERWRTLRERFPPSMRNAAFSLRKSSAPDDIRIVGEQRQDGVAILELGGSSGQRLFAGEAELRRQGGEWRIDRLDWRER